MKVLNSDHEKHTADTPLPFKGKPLYSDNAGFEAS